jgi:AraC-like DNA-binding protein
MHPDGSAKFAISGKPFIFALFFSINNEMRYIIVWVITVFCTGLSAQSFQQQQIDSLRKVISQFEGEEKLEEYKKLILVYFEKTDTVLFQLYDDMDAEARKQDNFDYQCFAKWHRLKALHNRFMFDEIIREAPKYLEFFRNEGKEDHIDYYNSYYLMIRAFTMKGDIETANGKAQQMYEQVKTRQNKAGMALALYAMSDIYEKLYNKVEREKALREAIELFEDINNPALIDLHENAYARLCQMMTRERRFDEAAETIVKYEKFIRRMEAQTPTKIPRFNFWALNIVYYTKTGEYDKAEMYCDSVDNATQLPLWLFNITYYRTEILYRRKQYDQALKMVDKALELATDVNEQTMNAIRRMKMQILVKTGQAEALYDLAMQTMNIKDSLYRKDLAYQIDELRTRFDVDRHVREKKYMQRYTAISSIACILLIIALYIWIHYSRVVSRKNRGLMRKISEQDMMFAERERSLNVPPLTDFSYRDDGDDDSDTVFARLNRVVKAQLFVRKTASRSTIAKSLGINERALYDCIKSNTGLNFTNYIAYMRLTYARELLANTDRQFTMDKIAQDAGFGSRATFYRLFKENYGLTPDEFRKLVHKTPKSNDET